MTETFSLCAMSYWGLVVCVCAYALSLQAWARGDWAGAACFSAFALFGLAMALGSVGTMTTRMIFGPP